MATAGMSIVVPVYNVEQYLEDCLKSLCKQITTYEYEIILVNDGATDRSGELCKEWAQKDTRIRYYEKMNEGLGPTRNYGMSRATYPYVTFVDSDDWIHESYVQKMLDSILESRADIVYCDCFYFNQTYKTVERASFRRNLHEIGAGIEERMAFGYPNIWGAVYKKELWQKSGIEMPGIVYEDTAVYGVLLTYTEKVEYAKDALYYYRVGRPGSLMQQGVKDPQNMVNALKHLVNLAHSKQVLEQNRTAFLDFCVRQLECEWDNNIRISDENRLQGIQEKFKAFLEENFPDWERLYCQNAIALGSYNSVAVYNRVKMFREISKNKYQFSGLISIMSETIPREKYRFNEFCSKFRREVIGAEMEEDVLGKIGRDRIIVLDLLDDIWDIIKVGNGHLNKTDALYEAVSLYGPMEIIPRESEQCEQLWRESAKRFAEWARFNNNRIVLLKLKLCTVYGSEEEVLEFEHKDRIEQINEMLNRYYDYFQRICPECACVELDSRFEFTEKNFRFGCRPYHYNSFAYYLLAYETLKRIREWDR